MNREKAATSSEGKRKPMKRSTSSTAAPVWLLTRYMVEIFQLLCLYQTFCNLNS